MSGEWRDDTAPGSCGECTYATLCNALDGTLDPDSTNWVLEHLETCQVCRSAADVMLQTAESDLSRKSIPEFRLELELSEADRLNARRVLGNTIGRMSFGIGTTGLPKRFGKHYKVIRALADGGMSQVFECVDIRLKRRVAVKVLSDMTLAPARLERLRREAAIQAGLKHPGIVQLYEVEFDEYPPYLVMELMEGGTLRDCIRIKLPGPKSAARIVARLARALDVAHQQGVIHRDIKPSNVLLSESFDPLTSHLEDIEVKLADFGLAKMSDSTSSLTKSKMLAGTPSYMSPEQTQGNSDRLTVQSDVYGLGVLLYEMLTGRPPLLTDNLELTLAIIREVTPVEPRQLQPNVSRDLNTICMKCLQKEPKARYATASELAADLENFVEGRGIRARPVGPLVRFSRWCRRNRTLSVWIAVALASLLSLAVGSVYFAISQSRLRESSQMETRRALAAERESRSSQLVAEAMEAKAAMALRQAEDSQQQSLTESDLSRNFFFAGMRALDKLVDRIEKAGNGEKAGATATIVSDARKEIDGILKEFARWPETLSGGGENSLNKLSPLQMERLFRDALSLWALKRFADCEALIGKISRVCANTAADHPDFLERRNLDLKCGSFLSYLLERQGETDAAVREIERVWVIGIEALAKNGDDQEFIFRMNAVGQRYVTLLEKVGRKEDAARIRQANEKIPRDHRMQPVGESKGP